MRSVFLIFEYVPEETKMYYIPDVSEEDLAILDDANGKHINIDDDTDSVNKVMDFIAEKDNYCEVEGQEGNCKWNKHRITYNTDDRGPVFNIWDKEALEGSRPSKTIDRVYFCGMIL